MHISSLSLSLYTHTQTHTHVYVYKVVGARNMRCGIPSAGRSTYADVCCRMLTYADVC